MQDTENNIFPIEDAELESGITPDGWEKVPTVKDLKQDLTDSNTAHQAQVNKIENWLHNLNVTGHARIKAPKGFSQVQPKLIRKQAEWRYASLSEPFLATENMFSINPVTWEDTKAAEQNKLVLNNQMNTKIDKVRFVDEYVRASVDEGTVIVKVCWEREETEVAEMRPIVEFQVNPEMQQVHEQLAEMKENDPTSYGEVPEEMQLAHDESVAQGVPLEATITGYEEVMVTKVLRNHPNPEVCDFRNVIIDPSCGSDLDKASFIIHSFETSIAALKKSGKYTNLDKINVEANSPLSDPDHEGGDNNAAAFNFSDAPRKRLIAYEYWGYWDIAGTGLLKPIVATWVGDVMIRLEDSPYPDNKLPFFVVATLPVKNSVYGEPDGELLEDNQKIIGAVTRGMIDIMGRSANGQQGTRKDALDAVNRRKFTEGKDYEYNANVDPRLGFYMHTYPEIPQSAQFMLMQQNADAESMTGVKAFSAAGISGDALGKTATGARGVMDAASKREAGMLRRLAGGMVKLGRKMLTMNAEFLEDEEIIRITNESFVAIRREDLGGNFDLILDISTIEEDNAKAQESAFMLQTVGPDEDPEVRRMLLAKIFRLRKMPDIAKKLEDYKPAPDPMAERMAELQAERLEAEIEEIRSRTLENETDAQLNEAKAQTEGATTREKGSKADLNDLDFLEQESGTKQERQRELQSDKDGSQAQLKLLDNDIQAENSAAEGMKKFLQQ